MLTSSLISVAVNYAIATSSSDSWFVLPTYVTQTNANPNDAEARVLRAEVYAHAMRASQNCKKEVRREKDLHSLQ